jgi:hypothetical protein
VQEDSQDDHTKPTRAEYSKSALEQDSDPGERDVSKGERESERESNEQKLKTEDEENEARHSDGDRDRDRDKRDIDSQIHRRARFHKSCRYTHVVKIP